MYLFTFRYEVYFSRHLTGVICLLHSYTYKHTIHIYTYSIKIRTKIRIKYCQEFLYSFFSRQLNDAAFFLLLLLHIHWVYIYIYIYREREEMRIKMHKKNFQKVLHSYLSKYFTYFNYVQLVKKKRAPLFILMQIIVQKWNLYLST